MGIRKESLIWVACAASVVVAALVVDGRAPLTPVRLVAPSLGTDVVATDELVCPGWTLVAGRGAVSGVTVALFTDGVARLGPCPGATARVRMTGTTVLGVGPWAVLETGDGVVFAGHVGPDGVEVVVEGAAWLAFTNDLVADGEDRNLRATLR